MIFSIRVTKFPFRFLDELKNKIQKNVFLYNEKNKNKKYCQFFIFNGHFSRFQILSKIKYNETFVILIFNKDYANNYRNPSRHRT